MEAYLNPHYRGRFAPTPSGPLHFGSLVAALGSYLDARASSGVWLLRIEDLDPPRVMPGSIDTILWQLESLGLHWDEEVVYQSKRTRAYREALEFLRENDRVYRCNCSRKEILETSREGLEGPVYNGKCSDRLIEAAYAAWRVRTPSDTILCRDRCMGNVSFDLKRDLGDFVLQRADGVFAYQLAVVVDDEFQGITDIVRGADLWLSTPRQDWLRQMLGYSRPRYLHLPLVRNELGEKLSKQTLAEAINPQEANRLLLDALRFLGQQPTDDLRFAESEDILRWASERWRIESIPDALV